jgi:hypothetical protein
VTRSGSGAPAAADRAPASSAATRFTHLLALATLGVGQPLFDLLGREPTFFVAHRAEPADLVLFALLPTLALAAVLLALEALVAAAARRAVALVHATLLALLAVPLGLLLARRLSWLPALAALGLALLLGVAVGWASRTRTGSSLLVTAGVLSALLPLHFLLLSPARRLVLPGSGAADAVPALRAPRPVPVVVVVFDELPLYSLLDSQGGIARRRFPAFAELAGSATWYRDTTSVAASTLYAVPSLLTGRYPVATSLPVLADHPRNLFTMLSGSHHVRALESLTQLCPAAVCAGGEGEARGGRFRLLLADAGVVYLHLVTPRGIGHRLPPIGGTWGSFGGAVPARATPSTERVEGEVTADGRRGDVAGQVESFLAGLGRSADGDRPGLHYLHVELPHIPWRYLPSGREYGPISTSFVAHGVAQDTTWRDDDWLLAQGLQRHLLQLGYADRVLARVLAALREQRWSSQALLVVTADHGLSFQIGEPGRELTRDNYAEVLAVPLFVRLPGRAEGAVEERPAELVDLLPTIAEVVGFASAPFPMDGHSLLRPAPARRDQRVVFSTALADSPDRLHRFPGDGFAAAEHTAVGRIVHWFGDDRPIDELYSLARRPELVGRAVGELRQVPAPRAWVALEQPWFFDRVRLDGRFLPAQVVGRLLPVEGESLADQSDLAVALNGVVRATTRSFRDRGAVRFSALLPEDGFVEGRNVVEVFLVEEDGRLRATVDRSGPRYRLRRDGRGTVTGIDATNGTSCTLDPQAVAGGLVHENWYLAGWAQPADRTIPFAVVMVFLGEDLVHTVPTSGGPPSGSQAAGRPGLERSGFRFTVPASVRADSSSDELRVFAVAGDRCSEVAYETAAPPSR